MPKSKARLVVEFDVTAFSKDQLAALEGAVLAQGEESDGQGGKRYHKGETEGHPDAPFLGTRTVKRGQQKLLVLQFDVTGFTKQEIGYLASEVEAQAEGKADEDEYPSTSVTSRIVTRP